MSVHVQAGAPVDTAAPDGASSGHTHQVHVIKLVVDEFPAMVSGFLFEGEEELECLRERCCISWMVHECIKDPEQREGMACAPPWETRDLVLPVSLVWLSEGTRLQRILHQLNRAGVGGWHGCRPSC